VITNRMATIEAISLAITVKNLRMVYSFRS
jgi:hypothetical protein